MMLALVAIVFSLQEAAAQNSGMKNTAPAIRSKANQLTQILSQQLDLDPRQTALFRKTAYSFLSGMEAIRRMKDTSLARQWTDSLENSLDTRLKQILTPGQYQRLEKFSAPHHY